MSNSNLIVFFWPGSPWASKITSFLALNNVSYTACHQPITMPRPDLTNIGVAYRRIPVVSLGRDIYCDTSCILERIIRVLPEHKQPQHTPEQKALIQFLNSWTDKSVFTSAVACIPVAHPLVTDPAFIQDRTALWGHSWDPAARLARRPSGIVEMRSHFDFLENTLLSDGRPWILGGSEPSLADIHGAWIFDWTMALEGAFPENIISESIYPKVYAWCKRYHEAVENATQGITIEEIDGVQALKRIETALGRGDEEEKVDPLDPLNLKRGQAVGIHPTDTGVDAVQLGPLLGLSTNEVTVGSQTVTGTNVRIHHPRLNYQIDIPVVPV